MIFNKIKRVNLKWYKLSILVSMACLIQIEHLYGQKDDRPNIIFIMSDDHAYQAISAYGSGLNQTPNIDRIADQGALFTRGYVTNSICAPSRAVLLTGKHSFKNGMLGNGTHYDWDQQNFAKILQRNGYETALIGKIHLDGRPQGFDYHAVLPGQGVYYNPEFIINGEREKIEGYVTEITTDLTLKWLDNYDGKQPFCLLYHQKAPHRNWMPAMEYLDLYKDTTFTPPGNYFDNYESRGPAAKQQKMQVARDMFWGWDLKCLVNPSGDSTDIMKYKVQFTDEQWRQWQAGYTDENQELLNAGLDERGLALWKYNRYIKDYLRCVKSVDDGVGRVLDYLDEHGLAENTIVVYTSDQGFYLGEHGWFDKRFMYEESFRTPIMIRYPKEIKKGTVVDELVQNLDFAPTFLDYAGIEIPDDMQGLSLRKLAKGDTSNWRDAIYYTYYEYPGGHNVMPHKGILTSRYKLIHFYQIDEWEMYDLKQDPNEMNNVYGHVEYLDQQTLLHKWLNELKNEYGDL